MCARAYYVECIIHILLYINVKGEVHPRTGHEGPEGEKYSCTLSLTSTLYGVGWSTPRLGRTTPGKDPVPIVQVAGWAPGPVWTGAENLAPTRFRARSESLYRLSFPGPHFYMYVLCMCIQRVFRLMKHSHWQAQCVCGSRAYWRRNDARLDWSRRTCWCPNGVITRSVFEA